MKHLAMPLSAVLMCGVAAHNLTEKRTKESVSLATFLEKQPLLPPGPVNRVALGNAHVTSHSFLFCECGCRGAIKIC